MENEKNYQEHVNLRTRYKKVLRKTTVMVIEMEPSTVFIEFMQTHTHIIHPPNEPG